MLNRVKNFFSIHFAKFAESKNTNKMYDPIEIADYFVKRGIETGIPVSPMKVQKLVYIAHGWNLAITNEPLLSSSVQAWSYGPVIPSIYHEFKQYGNSSIRKPALDKELKIKDENTKKVLGLVWDVYGKHTGASLSNKTHESDTPWDIVAKKHNYHLPKHVIIDNDIIKSHYDELYDRIIKIGD